MHRPVASALQVLYSKFGFMYTDIKMDDQDYILIREEDVIGIMPRSSECKRSGSVLLIARYPTLQPDNLWYCSVPPMLPIWRHDALHRRPGRRRSPAQAHGGACTDQGGWVLIQVGGQGRW